MLEISRRFHIARETDGRIRERESLMDNGDWNSYRVARPGGERGKEVHISMRIYIYKQRERERERER